MLTSQREVPHSHKEPVGEIEDDGLPRCHAAAPSGCAPSAHARQVARTYGWRAANARGPTQACTRSHNGEGQRRMAFRACMQRDRERSERVGPHRGHGHTVRRTGAERSWRQAASCAGPRARQASGACARGGAGARRATGWQRYLHATHPHAMQHANMQHANMLICHHASHHAMHPIMPTPHAPASCPQPARSRARTRAKVDARRSRKRSARSAVAGRRQRLCWPRWRGGGSRPHHTATIWASGSLSRDGGGRAWVNLRGRSSRSGSSPVGSPAPPPAARLAPPSICRHLVPASAPACSTAPADANAPAATTPAAAASAPAGSTTVARPEGR